MPADMDRLGQREGIWICSYEEFKGLSFVIREFIIQLSSARITQANRGDKMGLLYDFLTRDEFKMQVEAIVEGFTQMETDLIRDVFDGNDEPFEEVSKQEMRYELVRILPYLDDQEYTALSLYYEDEMTDWSEVGEIIGLEESVIS